MSVSTIDVKKVKEGFLGQQMIVLPPNIKKAVMKNPLIKRFHLTAIGFYPHASYHDRERKSGTSQYILLYCTEGTGQLVVNNTSIILKPNTYYILPKNIPHHYKSSQADPWSIYWVHFIGEFTDFLYKRYLETKDQPIQIAYDEKRIQLFDEIFELLENSFEMRNLEVINIKLLDFISSLIYLREISPSLHENDVVSSSIAYMKKNFKEQHFVTALAKQQNLSVSHYSRLFRNKTGSSPNQYFNQLKVQKSCQYLYFTDRNIKEICAELGFDDPYYFSRLFKKLIGMSPVNYKNQHRKNVFNAEV
jgi:AraC family transcriptional regulator of arabinose operon